MPGEEGRRDRRRGGEGYDRGGDFPGVAGAAVLFLRWLLFCSTLAFRCGVHILRVYRCYNCLSRLGALALLDGVQNYAPLMPRVDGATSAELAATSRVLVWTKRCRSCGEQKLEDEERCHVHQFACITEQLSM